MDLDDGRVSFGDPAAEAHALVEDPVCGRELRRMDAEAAAEYHGSVFYFCSQECKQRFVVGPNRYISAAASP
jgi:Cu+-exporting ATPase